MEAVRQWALSVCMACICVGILQQFTQNRSNFSAIKLILTLYVLVTAFAPFNSINLNSASIQIPTISQSNEQIDTGQIIFDQTYQNLCNMIIDACDSNSVPIKDADIGMNMINNSIDIIDIELTVYEDTDVEKAIQVAKNTLNIDVPVNIISGG